VISKKKPPHTLRGTRYEVRAHRKASRCLAGCVDVRGVGRDTLRLPRLAHLAARPTHTGRRSHREQGSRELRGQRPHLRREARLARRAYRGRLVRAAPHRADHARECLASATAPTRAPKDESERAAASANLLERRFAADAPNRKWIADFTSIWTAEGWLYVATVIDLFPGRVVEHLLKRMAQRCH
jgi:transposase InsO family protein